MDHLETVDIDSARLERAPFRMAVQWVNRPNLDFRGFSGLISSGRVRPGDRVRVAPSGKTSRVARIVTRGGDVDITVPGQSVTLTFEDEIDCSRGDVIANAEDAPEVADQFQTTIIWMAEDALLPGRPYWLKIGAKLVSATVTELKHKVNVNTLEQVAAREL